VEQIIPIKLQQPTITLNGNQLQSSYQNGNQWYLNDTLLLGETGQFITPSQSGNYKVKYTSNEGCEIFSDEFNHTVLSISDILNENKILFYPNPANTILFIKTEDNSLSQYQIFNSIGQVMKQGKLTENSVDVSGLTKGIYFIQLNVKNGQMFNSKFIKD
jgi:hypothetical protein